MLGVKLALLLTIFSGQSHAKPTVLGKNCDLAAVGGSDAQAFLAFDRELRDALSRQDAGKMALLVKYPLRINDDRGSYYLHDPHSVGGRYSEIFTPPIRDAVLKQQADTVWCNYSGIMYGDGAVWINPKGQGFAIEAINASATTKPMKPTSGKVEFACNSEKHRVIVDLGANGNERYRSWNKERSLIDKPDLELLDGKSDMQGSGPCVYQVWTFSNGTSKYVLEEIGGCDPDAPPGALGRLEVSNSDKIEATWWCQ